MRLENRIAVLSDVHGEHQLLSRVLQHCQEANVENVVLLGDLFDRLDQVESCIQPLIGWEFTGVIGNHEREALNAGNGSIDTNVARLLDRLSQRLEFDRAVFVHDEMDWKNPENGLSSSGDDPNTNVVFAGHTHYRMAKDDQGPIDLTLGWIKLREDRCYLINPGAVVDGEFAIWDRRNATVTFERI